MNANIRSKLKQAAIAPHLSKIRAEVRQEIGAYLSERLTVDDETGDVQQDAGALVAGWLAEHPVNAAATAAAAAAPAPARELPVGRQTLASALSAELMRLANPPKSSNGGP